MATTTKRRGRRRSRDEHGRFENEGWQEQQDWESGRSSRGRGFQSRNPEEQREVTVRGGRAGHGDYTTEYEQENYEQPRSRRQYEEDSETSGRGRSWGGRRGFAAMDPERQREIASEGGRAPHRGPRGFAAMGEEEQREIASEGGRAPHRGPRGFAAMGEEEQREIASRGGSAPHRGPRGFAAMDPEAQREIAARGGHASSGGWSEEYQGGYDAGYEAGRSHRGFAAMEPEQRRRIASRGGRSHRGD